VALSIDRRPEKEESKELSDDEQLRRRRKLIEFITALNGFLGIVVGIMSPSAQTKALFTFFLVAMIVSATLAYSQLLSGKSVEEIAGAEYSLNTSLIAGSFSIMLTIALASSLAQSLASSPLDGTPGLIVYGVVTVLFYTLFHFTLLGELRLRVGSKTTQGETPR
jgi:hypothetical protein